MDLAGKYRLIAELGQGGMATVYLAVSLGTSGFRKLAVVKLIRPQYASDPDLIQMFLDEARLCARLNHPNIVQTYDVGVDDGQYLMAMEYLDGVSLHTAVARLAKTGAPFPFALRAQALMEVLEGLRYAHELKDYDGKSLAIVHRDVTPHNIFITYDGQVKLLDFGIAKAATSSVQTATGVIKGKLTYMAPEQAMCDTIDARADLYAVGVMLWEAVTGRRRWPAGLSDAAVFTRVASGEPPECPESASVGLPPDVDRIVLKALAPKREDRYQTAAEMRADLDPVVRALGGTSLRDLGNLLQTAFAEDRKRIRQVIEDQFKAMDSGRPTPPSSNLPTVHPPRGTDSALHESLGDSDIERASRGGEAEAFPDNARKTGSDGTGITGVVTHTGDRKAAFSLFRWRVLVAAVGVVTVAIVATVGTRVLSHHGSDPTANGVVQTPAAAAAPGPATPAIAPTPAAPAPESTVARDAPAVASGGGPVGTTRRTDGPSHGAWTHRPPGGHGVNQAEPTATAEATAAPTTSPTQAPDEVPSLYGRPAKPKVNLERDNPWP
ncbi:MAG TPA: serine/threonine-protein kinase [Polyangiaceae bacterium]|nr:serine/threonine-protein kinase [Polyangiaceae bacterium]